MRNYFKDERKLIEKIKTIIILIFFTLTFPISVPFSILVFHRDEFKDSFDEIVTYWKFLYEWVFKK